MKAVENLCLECLSLKEPVHSFFLQTIIIGPPAKDLCSFLPEVHNELSKAWRALFMPCIYSSKFATLTIDNGDKEKGGGKLPLFRRRSLHISTSHRPWE